jgi:hypothetical protein
VTVGTTTPQNSFGVPSQGDANGAGYTLNFGPHGLSFSTAITLAATTAVEGATGPGNNECVINLGYV